MNYFKQIFKSLAVIAGLLCMGMTSTMAKPTTDSWPPKIDLVDFYNSPIGTILWKKMFQST